MIIKVLFVKQLSPNILKKMEDGLLELFPNINFYV